MKWSMVRKRESFFCWPSQRVLCLLWWRNGCVCELSKSRCVKTFICKCCPLSGDSKPHRLSALFGSVLHESCASTLFTVFVLLQNSPALDHFRFPYAPMLCSFIKVKVPGISLSVHPSRLSRPLSIYSQKSPNSLPFISYRRSLVAFLFWVYSCFTSQALKMVYDIDFPFPGNKKCNNSSSLSVINWWGCTLVSDLVLYGPTLIIL